ncbi:MAG: hypothetical protein IPQ23_21950 [Cytophagaceae bacterium]|nr:hypothetical protein [Cytophagaceae bacterium]
MTIKVQIPTETLESIQSQIANEETFAVEFEDTKTENYVIIEGTADYEGYKEPETGAGIEIITNLIVIVNITDPEGDKIDFDNETEAEIFKQLTDYLYD